MSPLSKLFSVADQIKFGISEHVVSIVFKKSEHVAGSFRCHELQRMSAASSHKMAVPDFEIGDPKALINI